MLKRNLAVKEAPERWQDSAADGSFDIVVCFEQRVFELVIEGKHHGSMGWLCSV